MLDVGADGVRENLQIIGFTLLSMISVLLVLGILALFGVIAATNGKFVRNPDNAGYNAEKLYCYSVDGVVPNPVGLIFIFFAS